MLRSRQDGEGIEGMGEDVIIFAFVSWLMSHVLFGSDPATGGRLAFQILRSQKEAELVFGMVIISGIFGDDDHHRAIVVIAMAQNVLTLVQLVEVVFVPVPFNHIKTVQIETSREEFEDVRFLGLEIPAGEEAQERHRQILAIAPLQVIHAIQTGATAAMAVGRPFFASE